LIHRFEIGKRKECDEMATLGGETETIEVVAFLVRDHQGVQTRVFIHYKHVLTYKYYIFNFIRF